MSLYNREPPVTAALTLTIAFENGSPTIDAETLADGLGVALSDVRALMRSGAITSRCERGEGDDEGRTRLTFFHRSRRFRLVVDAGGRTLQRSTIDFGERPLPASLRAPTP